MASLLKFKSCRNAASRSPIHHPAMYAGWLLGVASALFFSAPALADDRPLALVEYIADAPDAEVEAFDYVYDGDKIDLRPDGEMVLAYFDNCEVETFTGGLVRVREEGSKINRGGDSTIEDRPCQTAALALSDEAREAGVAVKRVTPFPEEEWRELTVAIAQPNFIWPKPKGGKGEATVSLYYLDAAPAELVWQGTAASHYMGYPADAPTLTPGMPYMAVVSYKDKAAASAVFSIDPDLQLPAGVLTSAVPLGL